jgi:hypothetical protein
MNSQTIQVAKNTCVWYPFRIMTREEIQAFGPDTTEEVFEEIRRDSLKAWQSAAEYKHLALQLGTAGVFKAESGRGTQGELLDGDTIPYDWRMSDWLRARLNQKTEMQGEAVILISIEMAFSDEGIPAVIAHEIGHYLDHLANGRQKKRQPREIFIEAFKRAGFREYSDDFSDLFSELIAETLGQYLCGHKLNSVLLAEINKILAKLTRKHKRIIQAFRNRQRKQNEAKLAA